VMHFMLIRIIFRLAVGNVYLVRILEVLHHENYINAKILNANIKRKVHATAHDH